MLPLLLGMFLLLYFLDSSIIANGHIYQNIVQNNKHRREIEVKTNHNVTKFDRVFISFITLIRVDPTLEMRYR